MKNSHVRLFVAVPLPQTVRKEIDRIQTKLKQSSICSGRYPNAEQAHLTLVFLGSTDTQELPAIKQSLKSISFPALTATVGPIGTFEKHGQIRIIYLEIICQELAILASLVANAVTPWTKQKEERPFVSHATIMRVKEVTDNEKLISFLQNVTVEPVSFPINSFTLMESELGQEGPQHTDLARYKLIK